jgi:hypothetical protein
MTDAVVRDILRRKLLVDVTALEAEVERLKEELARVRPTELVTNAMHEQDECEGLCTTADAPRELQQWREAGVGIRAICMGRKGRADNPLVAILALLPDPAAPETEVGE